MKKNSAHLLCGFFATVVTSFFGNNYQNYPEGFSYKINSGIYFTENKGQIHDQYNMPRKDILFGGKDGDLVFHLKNNGISYQLNKSDNKHYSDFKDNCETSQSDRLRKGMPSTDEMIIPSQNTIYRLDITWLEANQGAIVFKGKTLPGCDNYYLESCPQGAQNVKSYEHLIYKDIYEGIDLKWHQIDGHLKYDYIVAAGANYQKIALEIRGAENIYLDHNGDLVVKTPLGEVIENAPLVLQGGKILKAKWIVKTCGSSSLGKIGSSSFPIYILSFDIEKFNPNEELIIDPTVRTWGTYYGGPNSFESGRSCTTDTFGNVYMCGETTSGSGSLIATVGAHQSTYGGNMDAFLVKFDIAGVRQWATYYGGAGAELGLSCAADINGNIYMAGYASAVTNSSVIATAGSHQSIFGGNYDAFLVKFNSAGIRLWGTFYGGTENNFGYVCATDTEGNVYLAGQTALSTGTIIASSGSHQDIFAGGSTDAFLVKFNPSGVRQWGTFYGGEGIESELSCAVDPTNQVYLAGRTTSTSITGIATASSHQPTFAGGNSDAFVVKFSSNGIRQWATYYGGSEADHAVSCASDINGNVYLTGHTSTNSGTAIATPGSLQPNYGGGLEDAFLVKFSPNGIRKWGTYYGEAGSDKSRSCATDTSGNVYMAGTCAGTSTALTTPDSHQPIFGGIFDAFLVKFDSVGQRQWGTYYGTAGTDEGYGCTVSTNGEVYLVGNTNFNSTAIATPGSHQPTIVPGGAGDCFLVQFKDSPTSLPSSVSSIFSSPKIYPNPFQTIFKVSSIEPEQLILIYNSIGQIIYTVSARTSNLDDEIEINLSNQNQGIYFIRIGSITKKIIKE